MNQTLRNLLVAGALMLVGILTITAFLQRERTQLVRGKQEVEVLVASRDIPAGTPASTLRSERYLETTRLLREDVPPSAIRSLDDIAKDDTVNAAIAKGDLLSLAAFGSGGSLQPTASITGTERLYAVPIPAASDAAGLIKAGDHVDISAAIPDATGRSATATVVARDVEVVETPDTLRPDGLQVEPSAPSAEGETKLYVFKTTDREWMAIKQALANADDDGLMLALRPASRDRETDIEPPAPSDQ